MKAVFAFIRASMLQLTTGGIDLGSVHEFAVVYPYKQTAEPLNHFSKEVC